MKIREQSVKTENRYLRAGQMNGVAPVLHENGGGFSFGKAGEWAMGRRKKFLYIKKKAERLTLLSPNYLRNPFIICSAASFSVRPRVISFISCSPAIFPIAAS